MGFQLPTSAGYVSWKIFGIVELNLVVGPWDVSISRIGGIPQLGSSCALFLGFWKDEGIGRFGRLFFWSLLSYKEVGELHFDEWNVQKKVAKNREKVLSHECPDKIWGLNLTSIFRELLKCCFFRSMLFRCDVSSGCSSQSPFEHHR